MEGYQWRGARVGGKGRENKKHNWISTKVFVLIQGEGKNNIGNGEAKELTYMTHEHELRGVGEYWREVGAGWRRIKGENGATIIT